MTNIVPFTYGTHDVRTVVIDGEPWFVLADLTRVLDLRQFRTDRLDDALIRNHPIPDRLGRTQQATIVSEPGMYEVVIRSDKPEAAAFRRWITGTVLPQIRKTGSFGVRELSRLELIDLARESEVARIAAEERVAELAPKAKSFDLFLGSAGDMSVNEAAKVLCRDHGIQTGEQRLFAFMQKIGWIYRDGKGKPIPYQAQVDAGRLVAKARWYTDEGTGEQVATTPQVRVTAKGLDALRAKLAKLTAVT